MRKESMYLYLAEYWGPSSRASFASLLQFIYSILKVLRMVLGFKSKVKQAPGLKPGSFLLSIFYQKYC